MKSSHLYLFAIAILTSCSVYTPNTLHTPLFVHQGQASVGAHINQGFNIQGSYAVTDHIAIMGNLLQVKNSVDNNSTSREGNGALYELGAGYYTPMGKTVFEINGGIGFGNLDIEKNISSEVRKFEAKGTRFFLQPSLGYVSKNFEAAFTTRAALLKFNNISTTYLAEDLSADDFVDIDQPTWLFIEPAITLRAGLEKLKFQVQIGKSIKTNKEELGYDSGMISFGLVGKF